ncbi:unnamed protein product [Urochloa decumbens]|uniref:non-specific serine/threonine protein kinase n=1 Tax=Urochloa decumbens TaxID=240449 RepID=A0ABC8Z2R5_9POAL
MCSLLLLAPDLATMSYYSCYLGRGCCLLLLLLLLLLVPHLRQAAALSFQYDFSIPGVLDRADLMYIHDSFGAGDRVILTKMTNGSVGRVAYAQPVRLWDCRTGMVASFTTTFSFAIGGNHNITRGDGMAFFIGPFPPRLPPNSGAGFLGLYSNPNLSGSLPTVGVEFDTFWNQDLDPPGVTDHVGININSIHSANWTLNIPDLGLYGTMSANVTYDAGSRMMAVSLRLADGSTHDVQLPMDIVVAGVPQQDVAIGFSASTGSFFESHHLLSWYFSSTDMPAVSRESSYQELPEMSTSARIYLPVPMEFSYEELSAATDGFNKDTRFLGSGCFGEVYEGDLRHPSLPNPKVAVKKLKPLAEQSRKNYISEIMILGLLNHRNLVRLVGWCDGGVEKQLLVYELVQNKSIDEYLHGPARLLMWSERYRIALGVARAIEYLQAGCHNLIVLHRDIKPSNVLLDEQFEAKLGDFGLVRWVDPGQSSLGGTQMIGTMVYMDPTCIATRTVSTASDVYSFGVLLLEMATGKKLDVVQDARDLVRTVHECYDRGKVLEAVDNRLNGFHEGQAKRMLVVGLLCVQSERRDRPEITNVIKLLSDLSHPLPDFGVRSDTCTNAIQQNS